MKKFKFIFGHIGFAIRNVLGKIAFYAVDFTFRPTWVTDCVLWLEGSKGITLDSSDRVSAWADQSRNDHDLSQTTDTDRPDYKTHQQNDKPAVCCDTNKLMDFVSGFTQGSDFTVFAVVRAPTSYAGPQTIIITDLWQAASIVIGYKAERGLWTGSAYAAADGTIDGPGNLKQGTFNTVRFERSFGNYQRIAHNDGVIYTDTANENRPTAEWIELGDTDGSLDFCEIIMYSRALNLTEIDRIEKYLEKKYALHRFPHPLSLGGCSLWLDADQGLTLDTSDNVSAWADQSGEDHDVAQSLSANRPAYVENVKNEQPVIRFDETTLEWLDFDTEWAQATDVTLFIVFSQDESNVGGMLLDCDNHGVDSNSVWIYNESSFEWAYASDAKVSVDKNVFYYGRGKIEGSNSISIAVNGGSDISDVIVDGLRANWNRIGMYFHPTPGSHPFEGDIAEIIIFDHLLNEDEIWGLETYYLESKYEIYGVGHPKYYDNLQIWLDAGQGITIDIDNRVAIWADQSGNDYDFFQNWDKTLRPLYIDLDPNVDKPSLNFAPAAGAPYGSAEITIYGSYPQSPQPPQTDNCTVFVVARCHNEPATKRQQIIGGWSFSYYVMYDQGGYGTEMYNEKFSWASPDTTDPAIVTAQFVALTSHRSRVNGGSWATGATPSSPLEDVDPDGKFYWLRVGYIHSFWKLGDNEIMEIIVFKDYMSDAEIGEVESYLSKKYGITLS